jgi:hypothetical protein
MSSILASLSVILPSSATVRRAMRVEFVGDRLTQ